MAAVSILGSDLFQLISFGCALAAYGEVHFKLFGFLCQCAALAFEASRLVMIQLLLHGLKVSLSVRIKADGCLDGPTGVAALLRASLRHHQRLLAAVYRGTRAFLRLAPTWSAGIVQQRRHRICSECCGCIPDQCGIGVDPHPSWCAEGHCECPAHRRPKAHETQLLITGSVVAFGNKIMPIQVLGYG